MPYNNFFLVVALKPRMNTDIYLYKIRRLYILSVYCNVHIATCIHNNIDNVRTFHISEMHIVCTYSILYNIDY